MALQRMFSEVLFWFNSFRYEAFPQEAPQQIIHVPASHHGCVVAVLPFMLGVPPWTPLPIDFTA
jgi:hypothetical protein